MTYLSPESKGEIFSNSSFMGSNKLLKPFELAFPSLATETALKDASDAYLIFASRLKIHCFIHSC